jgi:hypothetical protein
MLWYFITASYSLPINPGASQPKFSVGPFYADDLTAMSLAQGFFLAAKNKDPQIASVVVFVYSVGDEPGYASMPKKGWVSRDEYMATLKKFKEFQERQEHDRLAREQNPLGW